VKSNPSHTFANSLARGRMSSRDLKTDSMNGLLFCMTNRFVFFWGCAFSRNWKRYTDLNKVKTLKTKKTNSEQLFLID
jgi:hypothetical protein